tara:strand:+ start:113 stop:1195 length:1083 start_codon:yes stop_codon:yes gene_type:complete
MKNSSRHLGIILCTYNNEDNIQKAIESCQKISKLFAKSKIVIIDDMSSDKTRDICMNFIKKEKDINIQLHSKTENKGVSDSRNIGIRATKECDIVTFVDGDDEVIKDGWSEFANRMTTDLTDITAFSFIKEKGEVQENVGSTNYLEGLVDSKELHKALLNYLMRPNKDHLFTVVWAKVYKRAILEGITFDTEMNNFEDLMFNITLIERVKSYSIFSEPGYKYTVNKPGTSLSNTSKRSIVSTLTMNRKAMKKIKTVLQSSNIREQNKQTNELSPYYHCSYAYISIIMSRETASKCKNMSALIKISREFSKFARTIKLRKYAMQYKYVTGGGPYMPYFCCRLGLYKFAVCCWYWHGLKARK